MRKWVYRIADYPRTLMAALDKSLDASWALLFPDWEIHLAAATVHRKGQFAQERTLAFGTQAYHVDP